MRQRLKCRFGVTIKVGAGMAQAVNPVERPKRVRFVILPKAKGHGFVSCGPLQDVTPPVWVRTPDAVAKCVPAPERRRKGESALMRIALKWRPTFKPRPPAQNPEGR